MDAHCGARPRGAIRAEMARKPQKKRSDKDPEQYARFVAAAREAEASNDPKDLERAVKTIAPLGSAQQGRQAGPKSGR